MGTTILPNYELLSKNNHPDIELFKDAGYTLTGLHHIDNIMDEVINLDNIIDELYDQVIKINYSYVGTTTLMFNPIKNFFNEEALQVINKCKSLLSISGSYVTDKKLLESEIKNLYISSRDLFNHFKTVSSKMQDFSEDHPEE